MSNEIGPLDFLFCEKCDKHVGERFYFDHLSVEPGSFTLTEDEKRNRVAPIIQVKAKPFCRECARPLIQKWISVSVTIEGVETESK